MTDSRDTLLSRAIAFAAQQHQGDVRKGTDIPYIVHPMEAAAIVASMTTDREVIAAAVLHDTMEDCGVTYEELERLFGRRVADLVLEESEKKQKDAAGSWENRKETTILHLQRADCSQEHKMLTLGDKLSNLRAIHQDLQTSGDRVWERFNQKDRKMHEWYYRSIGNALDSLTSYPVWTEYDRLLNMVFEDREKG